MRILRRRRATGYPEDALAAARDLVKARNHLDAIRLLTEANRVQRDRRIERRLVELRFEAFRANGSPGSPTVRDEDVEDLFPGALIPEIGRDRGNDVSMPIDDEE